MRALIAFGLGVLLGALAAFQAGRRYEAAAVASTLAAGYVGLARARWRAAAGSVVLAVLAVAAGVLIILVAH